MKTMNSDIPSDFQVIYEATPNPQSMKFILMKKIADEALHFSKDKPALRSPLAQKIFGFPWAKEVFIGSHFVTITKEEWVDWEILAEPLAGIISEHMEVGEPFLVAPVELENKQNLHAHPGQPDPNDSPALRTIKLVIENEVRPAVAMDGGDVEFIKYENNVVYLAMKGACSGCPSSMMTLKQGIEVRIKEAVPEVKEVVSI